MILDLNRRAIIYIKLFGILSILTSLLSCGLKENYEKVKQINKELQSDFNHEELSGVQHWSTEEGGNNFIVTFYEYEIDNKINSDLEHISNKVISKLLTKYPDFKKLDFIEVRFTKESEDKEDIESFITFKKANKK